MRTIIAKPTPKGENPLGLILIFAVILVVALAVGGWAVMVALGIVGVSVSFWEAVAFFSLLRFFILPGSLGRSD